MTSIGLRLRHIIFTGPNKEAAKVGFGPGLNIIYGASDTGKSFILEAIDFMLGAKPPLRELPERVGYDAVLLGVEALNGEFFTAVRSVDGGGYKLYSGLHEAEPTDVAPQELADIAHPNNPSTLSSYLLERCGLSGKRVRKNKLGDTVNLSIRHIARLLLVTETEITETRSPLLDGNPTADTPNFATFKLLLTGVDDSALVSSKSTKAEDLSREAQLDLLDDLDQDYRSRLKELTKSPAQELEDQLERLNATIGLQREQLSVSDSAYRDRLERRRGLRKKLEEGEERRGEVAGLIERFTLLEQHYVSDIERLKGLEEGGTLFIVLGHTLCPLCGAEPSHQNSNANCDGNVSAVVSATRAEIAKIELLRQELRTTMDALRKEGTKFDRTIPTIRQELGVVNSEMEGELGPALKRLRASYGELADKRGQLREALSLYQTIQDIESRKIALLTETTAEGTSTVADGDLPTIVAEDFARRVESILKLWHFPNVDRVSFESKARDLVISGKLRSAHGKGLRAITHAAFTIGLLDYCRVHGRPHPGFVILDSPLLTYRAPESREDDLRDTDLNEQFYSYLRVFDDDRQAIIIENTNPPASIASLPQVTMFTKNRETGRFGLFPVSDEQPATPFQE